MKVYIRKKGGMGETVHKRGEGGRGKGTLLLLQTAPQVKLRGLKGHHQELLKENEWMTTT